jgi:hypothetical protein
MTDTLPPGPTAPEVDYGLSRLLVRQQPLSIVIDIDDVLFPWYRSAHAICEAAGITNGVEPTTWEVWEDYGIEPEQWWATLRAATLDGSLYEAAPYEGSLNATWRLEAAGHFVHLVTARGTHTEDPVLRECIEAATHRWLAAWHFPYDSLTFSADKTIVPADFAVDDNTSNYDALERAGAVSFLVNQPWNAPYDDGRRRVDSLAAFAAIILGDPA